ncbi:MAG: hypothetical protein GXZ11_02515 [Tissierellia bacterium]|nr:hypothetical protein [Tissierellia bacterium]
MKRSFVAAICVVLLLSSVLIGCNNKEEIVEYKLTPRTFSETEQKLISSVSSAKLLPFEYNVDARVKKINLSLLQLDDQGLWQVVKEVPFAVNESHKGEITVEFYPDLVALSSLVDSQPALKAAALQMFEPDAGHVGKTEATEIVIGRSIPLLMIFGGPVPEGGAKSMTPEGWGDSGVLLAEKAKYALTVTFLD